jgi:hypothetical protein
MTRTTEHPAVSRRRGGSGESTLGVCFSPDRDGFFVPSRPSPTDPVSRLSHPTSVTACESLRSGPHARVVPRSLVSVTREGHAAARSDATSVDEVHFDDLRLATPAAREEVPGPASREPAWLRWFCRHRASHYAPSPRRFRAGFSKHGCLDQAPVHVRISV